MAEKRGEVFLKYVCHELSIKGIVLLWPYLFGINWPDCKSSRNYVIVLGTDIC